MLNVVPVSTEQSDEATFDDFWVLYPRHEAKKDARKAWERITSGQRMQALIGLTGWRRVFLERDSLRYVPLPASWLNGERWEDELPSEYRVTSAAHRPAEIPVQGNGIPMPAHVREMIARLRNK